MLSLVLILNLILIPGIHSQAATYPATTSFTYNYDGYDYQFYFSGEVDSPQDYRFDSSALDYLINKASEGLNLSISSGLGAKIDWISGIVLNSVFDFYRNFVVATDKVIADWIVWTDIYGFTFEFTGLDSNYPGHETYGSAYGWRFTGWLGEKIDLVLDSQGMLYGSNPIGNYTFSDDERDFGIWSIHQSDGDDIWMPSVHPVSFGDLPEPYIVGKSLYFYVIHERDAGSPYAHFAYQGWFKIEDFTNTFINAGLQHTYGTYYSPSFMFFSPDHEIIITNESYTGSVNTNYLKDFGYYPITSVHGNFSSNIYRCAIGTNVSQDSVVSFNLPYYSTNGTTLAWDNHSQNNYNGMLKNSPVSGNGDIYLASFSLSPVPSPVVIPVDEPIPVSDIEPDPFDFDPDPDDDPDPVPGIDYPVPDPTPVPVPPLPPLVSGNDDLWPDMNGVFEVESEIDGFLGGLSNFEFTPLRTLVEGFSSSLIWVSTIMMTLYNGSDFSILFVVLSIFFIAAALLGIYKWWTH